MKNILLYAIVHPEYWGADLTWFEDAILYVPKASVDTYKNSDFWNDMSNIKPIDLYSGIDKIRIEISKNNPIYNLNEQRIVAPQKGQIYIKKGVKYINR